MSVIVKGMQMPKACMLCPIYDREYGECDVLHDRNPFPFLSEDTYRYDATKEIHKDCPLVDTSVVNERPHGEWKHRTVGNTNLEFIICSNCSCGCPSYSYIKEGETEEKVQPCETTFCPNCGADMRKPNCVTCDHFGKCEGCEKGEEE